MTGLTATGVVALNINEIRIQLLDPPTVLRALNRGKEITVEIPYTNGPLSYKADLTGSSKAVEHLRGCLN